MTVHTQKGDTTMALEIKTVTKSEVPRTNVPGRTRQPSDFDDILPSAYAEWKSDPESWKVVNYDGSDAEFEKLESELGRSAVHFGYGKSVRRGKDKEGNHAMFFQVRDKLKTGRRKAGEGAESGDTEKSEDTNTTTETETPTIVESSNGSAEDEASTPTPAKRERGRFGPRNKS